MLKILCNLVLSLKHSIVVQMIGSNLKDHCEFICIYQRMLKTFISQIFLNSHQFLFFEWSHDSLWANCINFFVQMWITSMLLTLMDTVSKPDI